MHSVNLLPPKFEQFYADYWGARWPSLKHAIFSLSSSKVVWQNPWINQVHTTQDQFHHQLESTNKTATTNDSLITAWHLKECIGLHSMHQGPIPRDEFTGLLKYYILDPGSVLIAQSLPLEGEHILDLCAAPGGKTLILFSRLKSEQMLISNEPSASRREQLIRTLRQYIPESPRQRIRVSGKPGGLFVKSHAQHFDSILVDAPCSGERYLFKNQALLSTWTTRYSERLAQNQYALLTAAFHALKEGGYLLFSTCSVSPLEGDYVVQRLLSKKKELIVLKEAFHSYAYIEHTPLGGIYILPDQAGAGPFYACLMKKISSSSSSSVVQPNL